MPPKPNDGQDLQFDRAVPATETDVSKQAVVCAACGASLRTWYYDVGGEQLCAGCKHDAQQKSASVREWGLTLRAGLFGLGAAVAGAIIYYGVIAITNFEIGIVALLIGFMVGASVRKGARGRGGRRLQLAAAVLTYFSVAMAYFPLALKGAAEGGGSEASDQSESVAGDTAPSGLATPGETDGADRDDRASLGPTPKNTSAQDASTAVNPVAALGMLLVFALALPVMVVIGSLPSGLISALIIGIGMRQAWTMTRAADLTIHGPFKVGRPKVSDSPSDGPTSTAA